jgi:hypothetical protein
MFLDLTSFNLVYRYRCAKCIHCLHHQLLFDHKDEGSMLVRNIGAYIPNYTASHHIKTFLALTAMNTSNVH